MKLEHTIIIFILVVFVLLVLTSSSMNYVPYYRDSRYLKAYPYEGFDAMPQNKSTLVSSDVNAAQTMDIFSSNPGSLECIGNSNSLTNSQGGLCLTKDQMKLMQTRGGNASGAPDKIGL